jgi:predicted enzyme related to lactoylglutathione lyase
MQANFILYVRDQAHSRDFYAAVLSRAPRLDVPGMTEFDLGAGAVLGLMPESGIVKLLEGRVAAPPAGPGPRAELYLKVDDVAAWHARAKRAGAAELAAPSMRDWGDYVGYVADPDGYVVAFAETRPA